jgi:two-component system, OmpR family, phosphate regulon response regulator PhoB
MHTSNKDVLDVLVIEDDDDSREAMVQILKMEGYRPSSAADGKTGVNKAREVVPDLILLDLNLPDIHGKQIIQMLRKDQSLDRTPILVLTASGRMEAQSAIEMGANAYFIKPIEFDTLLRSIPLVKGSIHAAKQCELREPQRA